MGVFGGGLEWVGFGDPGSGVVAVDRGATGVDELLESGELGNDRGDGLGCGQIGFCIGDAALGSDADDEAIGFGEQCFQSGCVIALDDDDPIGEGAEFREPIGAGGSDGESRGSAQFGPG